MEMMYLNFYISDLHFGHEQVIEHDKRPFSGTEEMDLAMVNLWNSRVSDGDHVYIVGDFCFRSENPADGYLTKLKGRKYLIIGNHDKKTLKNEKAVQYFESVEKMMHVSDGRHQICLCHFPIAEWNGFKKGHWHIYGHIHARLDDTYYFMKNRERALNAAACINGYMPVSMDELIRNNNKFRKEN